MLFQVVILLGNRNGSSVGVHQTRRLLLWASLRDPRSTSSPGGGMSSSKPSSASAQSSSRPARGSTTLAPGAGGELSNSSISTEADEAELDEAAAVGGSAPGAAVGGSASGSAEGAGPGGTGLLPVAVPPPTSPGGPSLSTSEEASGRLTSSSLSTSSIVGPASSAAFGGLPIDRTST